MTSKIPPDPSRPSEPPRTDPQPNPPLQLSNSKPSNVDSNPNREDPEAPSAAPTAAGSTSLHYSLLGPSLLKPGQRGVDQSKIAEIIYKASKGSKFFLHEEERDRQLTKRIEALQQKAEVLRKSNQSGERYRIDELLVELEQTRDLSQVIVHVDCDAFFASVEELERPELKLVPMAVGSGVLSTCNYKAREWGVRSGMAGHIAKKICPQLVFVPGSYAKYNAKAEEIRAVLARYDPNFEAGSCDEAFLNLTPYLAAHPEFTPASLVQRIRAEVLAETKLSISAGISPNAPISKICSNINKPNGQFSLPFPFKRAEVLKFIHPLSPRQINGIGRVFSRELSSIGISTVADIYTHRTLLRPLFGEKATSFLLNCYLGLGRTQIRPAGSYERKSVGTERTFRDLEGKEALREKLRETAEELEKDLERTGERGKTLVLKVKMATYEVLSRQHAISPRVKSKEELYAAAIPLLEALEKDMDDNGKKLKIRLMGLRVTGLVKKGEDKGKVVEGWFKKAKLPRPSTTTDTVSDAQLYSRESMTEVVEKKIHVSPTVEVDENGWEIWPDDAFETAQQEEREEELKLTQELDDELEQDAELQRALAASEVEFRIQRERERDGTTLSPPSPPPRLSDIPAPVEDVTTHQKEDMIEEKEKQAETWNCPICNFPQPADDLTFNQHVDFCLSKGAIREAVQQSESNVKVEEKVLGGGGGIFGAKRVMGVGSGKNGGGGKGKRRKVK